MVNMQGRAPLFLILTTATLAAQIPARIRTPTVLPISAITIAGNKALSNDAILTASGLKINENGGSAIFDAARDRLLHTGYFDLVSYSFRQQDLGFAVTFTVVEVKQVYPVRAEALPITPAEMAQALKAKDPLFNGLLPGTKQVIDRAAKDIEDYLGGSHPGMQVRARVVATGPERFEVQFTPAEGLPVIADVTFEGTTLVSAAELHVAMVENGIGQVFSETGIHALLNRIIQPFYEKQGYMAVSFPAITSKPAASVKGVEVHVTVVEGPQFRLGNVSVRGDMAADARRILRMANVPQMETVNFDEFTKAVPRVRDTLRNEGYLDAAVDTGRDIDSAHKSVDVWFDVKAGDRYMFGRLDVIGLGLDGEAAIRKMWGVKPGDPFPGGYQDRFVRGVKDEQLFDNLGEITVTPTIDRQTHIVDVMLHFATAPTSPRSTPTQF